MLIATLRSVLVRLVAGSCVLNTIENTSAANEQHNSSDGSYDSEFGGV